MSKTVEKGIAGGLVIAAFLMLLLFGALLTMLAWNFGAVVLIAACGGAASKIGLLTAFFANLGLSLAGAYLRGGVRT